MFYKYSYPQNFCMINKFNESLKIKKLYYVCMYIRTYIVTAVKHTYMASLLAICYHQATLYVPAIDIHTHKLKVHIR